MCFTSLTLLRARLPSALATTEIVTAWRLAGPAPLSSPPYESHLRRVVVVVVSLDIILATSYFLSSFTERSTEKEREREDEEGDSGEGRRGGGKEGSMARLLPVVALRCNTGAR